MNNYEKIEIARSMKISEVMVRCGIKLPEKGDRIACPFCGGKNKTKFKINEKTNSFYCFGCHLCGGPIQFAAAHLYGSTDKQHSVAAAEFLLQIFGISTEEDMTEAQQIQLVRYAERMRKFRREEERKKAIIEKEEKLYQQHKENEKYFAEIFERDDISSEEIMDRIVADCMVMQEQEYLDAIIKKNHLF